MALLNTVLFVTLFAGCLATATEFSSCPEGTDICRVTTVDITPCNQKVCTFVKKKTAALFFDFTPNFSASNLTAEVYWASSTGDILFKGMGSNDGCTYTTCPLEAGKSQTMNYSVRLGKYLPSMSKPLCFVFQGTYPLKWKVWNQANPTELCCFMTKIKIK